MHSVKFLLNYLESVESSPAPSKPISVKSIKYNIILQYTHRFPKLSPSLKSSYQNLVGVSNFLIHFIQLSCIGLLTLMTVIILCEHNIPPKERSLYSIFRYNSFCVQTFFSAPCSQTFIFYLRWRIFEIWQGVEVLKSPIFGVHFELKKHEVSCFRTSVVFTLWTRCNAQKTTVNTDRSQNLRFHTLQIISP